MQNPVWHDNHGKTNVQLDHTGDGKLLAVIGPDQCGRNGYEIEVFDLATGQPVIDLRNKVYALLAAMSHENNPFNTKPIHPYQGETSVELTPRGTVKYSGSRMQQLRLRHFPAGGHLVSAQISDEGVSGMGGGRHFYGAMAFSGSGIMSYASTGGLGWMPHVEGTNTFAVRGRASQYDWQSFQLGQVVGTNSGEFLDSVGADVRNRANGIHLNDRGKLTFVPDGVRNLNLTGRSWPLWTTGTRRSDTMLHGGKDWEYPLFRRDVERHDNAYAECELAGPSEVFAWSVATGRGSRIQVEKDCAGVMCPRTVDGFKFEGPKEWQQDLGREWMGWIEPGNAPVDNIVAAQGGFYGVNNLGTVYRLSLA